MTTLPDPSTIVPLPVAITVDDTEGPVIDKHGNLYFSHGEIITRRSPDGTTVEWARTGSPNGHKILPNGEHLICDGSHQAVLSLDHNGTILGYAAAGRVGDLTIRCPNDLSLDPDGGFYFTDSVAQTGTVIYVALDGTKSLVADNIDFANGVALSADRTRLLVAESKRNRILCIDLLSPGTPKSPPHLFCDLPRNLDNIGDDHNQPDGIAFDAEGRLWIAHWGMKSLQTVSADGKLLATYDGAQQWTSNLCFVGNKLDKVYVTGSSLGGSPGGVFCLQVDVPGLSVLSCANIR